MGEIADEQEIAGERQRQWRACIPAAISLTFEQIDQAIKRNLAEEWQMRLKQMSSLLLLSIEQRRHQILRRHRMHKRCFLWNRR